MSCRLHAETYWVPAIGDLLELERQMMIGTVPPSTLQAAPVT
jgi:hypothetical protein